MTETVGTNRGSGPRHTRALRIDRLHTRPGVHPYDEVAWERRDVVMTNWRDGSVNFEQHGVEFPDFWSVNAANIVTTKYFRGAGDSPDRESSLKQLIDRVVRTYVTAGVEHGYFATDQDAEVFDHELTYMLLHQIFSFNSPVWFNVGTTAPQQVSACQPYDALVSTPSGLVPIGELVERAAVGDKVYDAHGVTRIVAVKANGVKDVLRLHLEAGYALDVTADHLVWRAADLAAGGFAEAGELRLGQALLHVDPEFGGYNHTLVEVERIEHLGAMDVFDIQTESGEYLSAGLRVHNCFILSVDDTMESILNWYREEGMIFKGGSGSGVNLSRIRSSKELLSSGGTASGPVSFMRGADASAGTIKSGGATRRAAKMVVLDVDHPDVEEFIETKAREEEKVRVLRDAGFDMDLGGRDITSVQYQNANNSVRVSDEFMRAVEEGQEFGLRSRLDGSVVERVDAKALFRTMAKAAWACADPGIQYDDTINDWHTNPESGRITASNPCCFTGDTLVASPFGPVAIEMLVKRVSSGEAASVVAYDERTGRFVERAVLAGWEAGRTRDLREVTLSSGARLRCTPEHRFLTSLRGWTAASDLIPGDALVGERDGDSVVAVHVVRPTEGTVPVYDIEVDGAHNFVVCGERLPGVVVHNSEYMSLDNSSCNLASLNLLKFLRDDDTFDVERFTKAVEFVITAMDISICFADFPTQKITETTRAFRQLGIGYANLGALLMATGHAYDSEGGRAVAAAITSLMTGVAYRRSAELAAIVGPYDGYARNADPHKRVMRKHAAANDSVRAVDADSARILRAAGKAWQECLTLGERNGWRNAQASLIAPTGTIGLAMSVDTTGVEPDLALVKHKKLVGGASMQIVNQTVPRALTKLGYQQEQVEAMVEFIAEHGHVVGAPGLKSEHYEVFDCAMGQRSIAPMGHVRMIAAVQPFLSGAVSKTINAPESATVDDIEKIYFEGWKLGLKSLAVYRDNCKVGQPLSDAKAARTATAVEAAEQRPVRKRLPKKRPSQTVSFAVGGAEGYLTAGSYPDDGLGEVFIKMSKQGSTLAGVMDAFSVAISIGLQYGVPLDAFVAKYINMRFDPAGITDDSDVRMAQSVMDYIFRRLALDYLPYERRAELGIFTAEERAAAVASSSSAPSVVPKADESEVDIEEMRASAPIEVEATPAAGGPVGGEDDGLTFAGQTAVDAPLCFTCGTKMRPAGSCYVCESCGSTSGCS